ncbi:hypothetical protein FRC14_002166 [Serendipita sp. 396]|nr:hypothetical protein FRC14_002166 [Serendipita sp. 396]
MSTSHEQPDRGSSNKRPRDEEESLDDERPLQRVKLDEDAGQEPLQNDVDITMTIDTSPRGSVTPPGFTFNQENLLPPSRKFLGLPPAPELPPDGFMHRTLEVDVGISQYIGTGLSQINGIIKQRFVTPLLVVLSRPTGSTSAKLLTTFQGSRTLWFMRLI